MDKLIDAYGATTQLGDAAPDRRPARGGDGQRLPVIPVTEGVDWYQYNTKAAGRMGHAAEPVRAAGRLREPGLGGRAPPPEAAGGSELRSPEHEAREMRFVARRLGFFLVTLWVAVTLNFLIPRLMPGNAAIAMMARYKGDVNPRRCTRSRSRSASTTHQSLVSAYFTYLGQHLHRLRFGMSLHVLPGPGRHEVGCRRCRGHSALVGITTILAFVLGTLIGLLSAWRRGGELDGLLPPIFVITSAFPYFWLALLAIWLFAIKLGWLPDSGGYDITRPPSAGRGRSLGDVVRPFDPPALTILVTSIGGWILTMRNNMISVLAEDYVRMARAKGLSPWRIMWTYAGRNAILPNLTGFAMSLGFVVGGAILVEFVFNYPGVGWMFLQSVENQDYALMQALFLLITVAVLVAILGADGATAVLDPRTRDRR